MNTDIPDTIAAADVASWSDEVDVVVIGFGIAGGCAAVTAAAAGASVLVLERAAAAGGTTSMAGGHFYLGGGTAVQQATGHDDTAEEMYSTWSRSPANPTWRRSGVLRRQRRTLQLAGGPWAFSSSAATTRAGRGAAGHRGLVLHRQREGVAVLRAGQGRRRAAIRCRCPVNRRRGDGDRPAAPSGPTISASSSATRPAPPTSCWTDGAVVGVAWKHFFAETGAVKANSVIIAAGGFAMNPDMVAEYTPALGQERKTKHHGMVAPYILGNPNDDGLGIRMGVRRRVATNMDHLFITAAAYPPEILLTG